MKKIEITQQLQMLSVDYNYGATIEISELENFIKNQKADGATHIELASCGNSDDCTSIDMQAVICREETDEEYQKRLEKEARLKQQREEVSKAYRKQEYLKLKKEFENEK